MASQIPHFHPDLGDHGMPATAPHDARGGRYRRERSSPQSDGYRGGGGADEPQTPTSTSDMAIQDAMLIQQANQQRGVPSGQFGQSPGQRSRYPPSSANGGPNSRACPQPSPSQAHPQPPSYPGPPDDGFENSSPITRSPGQPRRRAARHARRLSGSSEPGMMPADAGPRPAPNTSPARGSGDVLSGDPRSREPRTQQTSPPSRRPGESGSGLDRVSSPSITQSVLHPLETKMREYYSLMEDEQRKMTELDAEIRALQEQRQQAEERFIEAKHKHDDYERQHMDVERALRGDFPPRQAPPQQQVAPSASWTMARPPSMESFDERPTSGRSAGGNTSKGRSRFRMSLFKG